MTKYIVMEFRQQRNDGDDASSCGKKIHRSGGFADPIVHLPVAVKFLVCFCSSFEAGKGLFMAVSVTRASLLEWPA